jgi:hypothetical protein
MRLWFPWKLEGFLPADSSADESMLEYERKEIVILDRSAFAEEVADIVLQMGNCEIVCFIEGIDREECNEKLLSLHIPA